ncbi:hypothetical protein V8F20_011528 [Naviculisporaceae sp. PSN 640]
MAINMLEFHSDCPGPPFPTIKQRTHTDFTGVDKKEHSDESLSLINNINNPESEHSDTGVQELEDDVRTEAIPVPAQATRCVLLKNMFNPAEENGEDWVQELEDDQISGGENAIKGLNGRYFGGRMITAQPVVDAVYSSLFSRARAT